MYKNKYILSIDFGGKSVKYLLIKNGEEIYQDVTNSNLIIDSHESAARDVVLKFKNLSNKFKIEGIAISFNSPVRNVSFVRWGKIEGEWIYRDFKKILHLEGIPENIGITILNDAKAALMAESNIGAAKDYKNSVMLTFGTAIGGAALIDGNLVNGNSALGAELSNPVMYFDGSNFDSIKLWHSYASMTTLEKNYEKISGTFKTGKEVFELYDNGDSYAQEVVANFLKSIAVIIYNCVYCYGQEITIIGGGISNRENIDKEIMSYVKKLSAHLNMEIPTKVAIAHVKNKAGNYGAYFNFINEMRKNEI